MNDQQNNQPPVEPNSAPTPIVPLAQDYPTTPTPVVEPVTPAMQNSAAAPTTPQQDNFSSFINNEPATNTEPEVSAPAPATPAEVTPDMVADFLSRQNSEITEPAKVQSPFSAPVESVKVDQPITPETLKTDPLDMWDEKPQEPEPLPTFVAAEPIIPATTTITESKSTSESFGPKTKKGSWIPVIILGLLVVMTAVIVLILLVSAQRSASTNQNTNSSVSSIVSSASSSIASTPTDWIEFTDGLIGVKFSLPPQSSYIEVQTPIKQIPYTATEIAIYQSKPKEWYYTPTGLMKFGTSTLDAQYISINRAPGRVSGIGSVCRDNTLCLVDTAVTFYKVSFNGSVDEFIAQVTQVGSTTSSLSATTPTPQSVSSSISTATSLPSPSAAASVSLPNTESPMLFGEETTGFEIGDDRYFALKKDNHIFVISVFAQTAETENLANQIINTISLSN